MEKYGFIYVTTNNINGKKYVGQKVYKSSVTGKESNWKSYLGSGVAITAALQKYGTKNFSKEIIDEAYSREELDEKELYYIKEFNAVESCDWYNIKDGAIGGNPFAGKTDEEMKIFKQKMSEITTENNNFRGKKLTEEHKKKIGEKSKGRTHTDETKQKLRKPKSKPMSDEHRKKLSEAKKGRKLSNETRRKMSEARRKRNGKDCNSNT